MYVNHDLSEGTSEFKSKSSVFHEDRALLGETETIAETQTSFTNLLVTSSSKFSWSPVLGLTCPYLVHRENNYLSSKLQHTSFTFLKIHFPHIWDYIASTKLLFIIQVWVLKVESHTCYLKNKTKQKNLWGGVTKMIKNLLYQNEFRQCKQYLAAVVTSSLCRPGGQASAHHPQKFFRYAFKNTSI